MKFILKIESSNDAFHPEPHLELARILRKTAEDIEHRFSLSDSKFVYDANGNRVGFWKLTNTEQE